MKVEMSESYLKADQVTASSINKLKLLDEGKFVNGQYGQKLELKVLANGQKYIWTVGDKNRDALIKLLGPETAEWIGKEVKIQVKTNDNGFKGIVLDPSQF